MIIRMFQLTAVFIVVNSCTNKDYPYSEPIYASLDIQGHRGCRGSLTENSVSGFLQALEWGVTTLEMDVVISKDHQVVVSHEPFMSHNVCLDSTGVEFNAAAESRYNLYKMTYEEIKEFDCGSKIQSDFSSQKLVPGPKPLLSEVIRAVEERRLELNLPPVNYNIETKSKRQNDGIFHPAPARFVEIVLSVIQQNNIAKRTIIQSFDPRTLQHVRKQDSEIATSLLVANNKGAKANIGELGFGPDVYSPNHQLVTGSMVQYLHQMNIALIPWTVNDTTTMNKLIKMGVDGIITDYPQRLIHLLNKD